MKKFKTTCIACNKSGVKMTKEHFIPQWLLDLTGTGKVQSMVLGRVISSSSSAVVPLCESCNNEFGIEIEAPVSNIFSNLLTGRGISDNDAELLVRWMWKFEGLGWLYTTPGGIYTEDYSLKKRVLYPIYGIRGSIVLAIALANTIQQDESGIMVGPHNKHSAIFAAGVFSKVAIMVVHVALEDRVPNLFSKYRLSQKVDALSQAKIFFPKTSFKTDVEAAYVTMKAAEELSPLHDMLAEISEEIAREQKR